MMRPINVGSATATLAPRLAALPATSRAHGSNPARLPVQLQPHMHVQVRDSPGDNREHRHARSSCPWSSDPPAGHDCVPSNTSPVMAGMYVSAVSPWHRHSRLTLTT